MIGWKDEKADEIQMYAQPINEPTQQMEPSLVCYELPLNWQTFLSPGKSSCPNFPAQVRAEQRGRPRWEQRRGQEVELKGGLAPVCGYFLKRHPL